MKKLMFCGVCGNVSFSGKTRWSQIRLLESTGYWPSTVGKLMTKNPRSKANKDECQHSPLFLRQSTHTAHSYEQIASSGPILDSISGF